MNLDQGSSVGRSRIWWGMGLLALLALLALLGRWDFRRRNVEPVGPRVVAQAGESLFTVDRLRAWLADQPEDLPEEEIRRWLEGWVEDQLLAQAALRAGLDTLAGNRELLARQKLRLLRGLLEEASLAESLSVSQLELRTWARANEGLLVLPEPLLRLEWLEGPDSLVLAGVVDAFRRGRLGATVPLPPGVDHGVTPLTPQAGLPPFHADRLLRLSEGETTPVLRQRRGWAIFRLLEERPQGWLPDPDLHPELVRGVMLRDLRWKRLQSRLETLRQESPWRVDLAPLLDLEAGLPQPR
jgi:hypothetical protein